MRNTYMHTPSSWTNVKKTTVRNHEVSGRLKSIILQLFFPEILFKFIYYSQNYSHILTIIPTKAALFSKTHANILIKHKQLYLVTNKYLK